MKIVPVDITQLISKHYCSAFVLYPTALAEKQGLSFKSQPDTSSVQRIAHLFCHTKANEQRRGMDSK